MNAVYNFFVGASPVLTAIGFLVSCATLWLSSHIKREVDIAKDRKHIRDHMSDYIDSIEEALDRISQGDGFAQYRLKLLNALSDIRIRTRSLDSEIQEAVELMRQRIDAVDSDTTNSQSLKNSLISSWGELRGLLNKETDL